MWKFVYLVLGNHLFKYNLKKLPLLSNFLLFYIEVNDDYLHTQSSLNFWPRSRRIYLSLVFRTNAEAPIHLETLFLKPSWAVACLKSHYWWLKSKYFIVFRLILLDFAFKQFDVNIRSNRLFRFKRDDKKLQKKMHTYPENINNK